MRVLNSGLGLITWLRTASVGWSIGATSDGVGDVSALPLHVLRVYFCCL